MKVGEICSRDVDLIDADESVREAARRMLVRQVGTLLLLDGEERPMGIVTDRDLATRVLATGKDGTIPIREIMSVPVCTISTEASIDDALRALHETSCRRLPVVDKAGKLVGIMSLDDVIGLLAQQLGRISRLLEREAPHPEVG